jgi:hypothetical protein
MQVVTRGGNSRFFQLACNSNMRRRRCGGGCHSGEGDRGDGSGSTYEKWLDNGQKRSGLWKISLDKTSIVSVFVLEPVIYSTSIKVAR